MAYMKMKPIKKSLKRVIDYILDKKKMGKENLSFSHHANQELADLEFGLIRDETLKREPKMKMSDRENLAHHIIQSHKITDKVTPEMCLEIAKKTAQEFTNNDYAYVIAVHTDKAHMHAHIIVNAYSHTNQPKLKNYRSAEKLLEISNHHCLSHGLSTSEITRQKGTTSKVYPKKHEYPKTAREQLAEYIREFINQSKSYEEFIVKMQSANIEVEERLNNDNLAFKLPGSQRAIKLSSLKNIPDNKVSLIKERINLNNELVETYQAMPSEAKNNIMQPFTNATPKKMYRYSRDYWLQREKSLANISTSVKILNAIKTHNIGTVSGWKNLITNYQKDVKNLQIKKANHETEYDNLISQFRQFAVVTDAQSELKNKLMAKSMEITALNEEIKAKKSEIIVFEKAKEVALKVSNKKRKQ